MSKNAKSTIIKSVTLVTAFAVITRALSFVFKIYVSQKFGAEAVGLYQISLSILLLLLSACAGGAQTVVSRKIAEQNISQNTEIPPDFNSTALIEGLNKRQRKSRGEKISQNTDKSNQIVSFALLLTSVPAVLILCIYYPMSTHFSFLFSDPRAQELFGIMLPALVTSAIYGVLRGWFLGRKKYLEFSVTELMDEVFKIILAAVFASGVISAFAGIKGVALALTAADVACVIVLFFMFVKKGGRLVKPGCGREITAHAAPLTFMRFFSGLMNSIIAVVLPLRLTQAGLDSAVATAEYGRLAGMAFPLIAAPTTVTAALATVLVPEIASSNAKGDCDELRRKVTKAVAFAVLVASLFFTVFAGVGKELGTVLFGDENAGKYIQYCSLLTLPMGLTQITTPILNSLGKEKNTFFHFVCSAAVLIPCVVILPAYVGAGAMAIGIGGSMCVTAVLNLICLRRTLGPFKAAKDSVVSFLCALPATLIIIFVSRLLSGLDSDVLTLFVCSALGAVTYAAMLYVFSALDFKGFLQIAPHRKNQLNHGKITAK